MSFHTLLLFVIRLNVPGRHSGETWLFVDVADFDVVAAAGICYVINVTYIHTYVHRQQTGTSCIYKQRKIPLAMQRRCEWQATSRENTHSKQCIHVHSCMNTCICVCVVKLPEHDSHYWVNRLMVETDKRKGDELTAWQAHSRTADSQRRSYQKRMHQLPSSSSSRYMFN